MPLAREGGRMTLDASLIAKINTPVVGPGATLASGSGNPGNPAPLITLDVSNYGFFDPSAALNLTPSVRGGAGGSGIGGTEGVTLEPTAASSNGTITYSYFNGGPGGAGGSGGAGAPSVFDADNDVIGSTASPYGGTVTFNASAVGGGGGEG